MINEKEIHQRIEQYLSQLQLEELEAKIAPMDCQKKPNHPDCVPVDKYGGPVPLYAAGRYGGPF